MRHNHGYHIDIMELYLQNPELAFRDKRYRTPGENKRLEGYDIQKWRLISWKKALVCMRARVTVV
jgi:hypothetical protein